MSETPAETIRRAATLMRERAEAATPGPWLGVTGRFEDADWPCVIAAEGDLKDARTWLLGAGNGGVNREADAAHAGSWHPLVALAVAGWLDGAAKDARDAFQQPNGEWEMPHYGAVSSALTIARVYLGEAVG